MSDSESAVSLPYRTTHDWETGNPITLTIIEAVERLEGDQEAPSRLYDYVNPDALEALLRPSLSGDIRPTVSVSFEYDGYSISAAGDGEVVIDSVAK